MVDPEPPRLYDCQQVADILGVGLDWVRRRVQSKEFPHLRFGRRVRFTDEHLRAILAAAAVQPPQRAVRSTSRLHPKQY